MIFKSFEKNLIICLLYLSVTLNAMVCKKNNLNIDKSTLNKNLNLIVCSQPPDSGPCRSYNIRYYYDSSSKKCVPFK